MVFIFLKFFIQLFIENFIGFNRKISLLNWLNVFFIFPCFKQQKKHERIKKGKKNMQDNKKKNWRAFRVF